MASRCCFSSWHSPYRRGSRPRPPGSRSWSARSTFQREGSHCQWKMLSGQSLGMPHRHSSTLLEPLVHHWDSPGRHYAMKILWVGIVDFAERWVHTKYFCQKCLVITGVSKLLHSCRWNLSLISHKLIRWPSELTSTESMVGNCGTLNDWRWLGG